MEVSVGNLALDPKSVKAQNKPVTVNVEFARKSGVSDTLEGKVHFRRGDALLTGSRGEVWPVRRERFLGAYIPVGEVMSGKNGSYLKLPAQVFALQIEKTTSVSVGSQDDVLTGHPGDWVVQYGEGDYGIVRASVFDETYELL
ncbi:PGDYG domain-containing protein [Alcanivorax sp.]|jgi:hypothetical protein|uniref:PGDYG domain-containing protein n=1 Tax=Alcanivorax sp. TaxID=1872427 RepID=UPI0032D944F0